VPLEAGSEWRRSSFQPVTADYPKPSAFALPVKHSPVKM
jgi:hypothetical protein